MFKAFLLRALVIPLSLWPQHLRAMAEYHLHPDRDLKASTVRATEAAGQLRSTTNWFGPKGYFWLKHIGGRDAPLEYLEIGSWEGMSAWFFARHFPNAKLHCIDTWQGSDENETAQGIEQRFDANLSPYADRVTKYKGESQKVLPTLAGREFDVIYIDGSHYADDVLLDALNCWPLLKPDGILIFDDFLWTYEGYPPRKWASRAIKGFLQHFKGEYELLHVGAQVIVRKTLARAAIIGTV